jgi:hypothetical protein
MMAEIKNTFFSPQYSNIPFFHFSIYLSLLALELWPERAPQAPLSRQGQGGQY